jgi:hypothetical protein
MTLSLNKLEKLLSKRGLIPKKYFTIDGLIVYIEVLSIANADSFMLYIPSKYDIEIGEGNDVFKIRYIDITEDGNIPSDYAGEPDNFDLDKDYDGDDIDLSPDAQHKNMEGYLEEKYNHPVSLKDDKNIKKDIGVQLREVFRQLRRLKFCTKSLKYKLAIIFNDYLCCIRRDDTYECLFVNNSGGSDERKLMVTIDLETLYEKIDSVSIDIKTVREGIYRVLDKNQGKHIRNIQKMLEKKNNLVVFSELLLTKKEQYSKYLTNLEQMLADLTNTEKKNVEKLMQIEDKYSGEASLKSMHSDIEKTHQIAKYENELSRINGVKQELIRNILIVKTKHENLSLRADNIMFDNIIMIDAILKNFVKLSKIK